jgi:streptomycin 6-kinase
MSASIPIDVPDALIASQLRHGGAHGRAWIASLPQLIAKVLDRWALRLDGGARHGMASLVLPVVCADGTAAALKLQTARRRKCRRTNRSAGLGWRRRGPAARSRPGHRRDAAGTARRDAATVRRGRRPRAADLRRVARAPGRGSRAQSAAPGRHRRSHARQVPRAVPMLRDPTEQRLVRICASAVTELISAPGDRLLHWDLHYDNVLAGQRQPWLVIDPKPLAGDPGFELLPALDNRWDEVVATGNVPRAVLRRFDRLTEVLGLDRQRATGWTLGRVLQNALWDIEDGDTALDPAQIAIAAALMRCTPYPRLPT